MNNIIKYLTVLLLVAGIGSGCENFLSPSVDQSKPIDEAIQSSEDIKLAVYGAYDDLNRVALYGRDFPVSAEVMSDNAFSNGNTGRFLGQDEFDFTVNSGLAIGYWDVYYEVIAGANIAINADIESTPEVDHYRGQAYALRALSHMNLLLAFGQQYVAGGDPALGVPYVTTYSEGNLYPSRDAIADVWSNIGADLAQAVSLLDPSDTNTIELNYWAAKALQTRYFLYTEQYGNAITAAEEIIDSGNFSITPAGALVATWESGSGPASLFEVAFTSSDNPGSDSIARIYRDTNYGDVEVTDDLFNEHDAGDVRLDLYSSDGSTHRMVSKYADENTGTDNVRIIRYAEVILNYAEALANSNREADAKLELDKITSNRGLGASYYATGSVENVLRERRLELAMEGFRLYDLIRTGRDIIPGDTESLRSTTIASDDYRVALPIPDSEIRANSNIVQNTGYDN